jgi:uncharacterized repeat protein (TIGR01451 family)
MFRRIAISTTVFVMLAQLFLQATPALAWTTYCDAAAFVADVTVADGTDFAPGTAFTKTWRLKNVGTCTWTTSYSLTWVSGDPMSAVYPVALTANVAPGSSVDVSANMVAPASNGTYKGFWQLKNASGQLFGIGSTASSPFWVLIDVATAATVGLDFVSTMCSASWSSGAGALGCPGTDGNASGFELQITSPQLENGTTDSAPGLLTNPQAVSNGYIMGVYPEYLVKSGDRFQSIVNCQYGATTCNVYFQLQYQVGSGPITTFWQFREKYEGLYYRANLDLSPLAGQTVKFILRAQAYGGSTNNRALWGSPRIASFTSGGTPPPTSPPSTPPPSTPPPSGCTDKASFIADITVPDYTIFAPNVAFTKTWRLKNTGTCTWTTSYKLTWVSGNALSAVYPVAFTTTVSPGQTVDLSANMVSPAANGTYQGNWMLQNASGTTFGIGSSGTGQFWVLIRVSGGATATPPPASCDRASFVADVTVPDYTVFAPSTAFLKTWRLKNVGTCTWTTSYKLVFVSGSQMSAPATVAFPTTVAPGATVDLSANMVAPVSAGTYQGNWMLQNASGVYFGIGSSGTGVFWVLIQVSGVGPTPTPGPTNTPGPSPTPGPSADLYVTMTDGTSTYLPGDFEYYTIVIGNNGPNPVTGATVSINAPIQTSNYSVSCVPAPNPGAVCEAGPVGKLSGEVYTEGVTIPVGGTLTYTEAVAVPHDVLSTMTNFASVAVPAGFSDPNPGNNSASDSNTAAPVADLKLEGIVSAPNYVPGGSLTYTYTVTNIGPSNAVAAIFNDSVSSQVTSWQVTCVPTPGATCTAAYNLVPGETSYGDTVSIPPGFVLTITIVVQIDGAATGSVTNTASISVPAGTTDPVPGNNSLVFSNNQ